MSVEGLWTLQSGSVDEPDVLRWGGMVVLETGRVFGGDSVMAYVGSYEVDRDEVAAKVRSWTWNNDVGETTNVFGMEPPIDYTVIMRGRREGEEINGYIAPEAAPDQRLRIRMRKIAELP